MLKDLRAFLLSLLLVLFGTGGTSVGQQKQVIPELEDIGRGKMEDCMRRQSVVCYRPAGARPRGHICPCEVGIYRHVGIQNLVMD